VHGFKLQKFLEASVVPEKFKMLEEAEANTLNPKFLHYDQEDQSIVT